MKSHFWGIVALGVLPSVTTQAGAAGFDEGSGVLLSLESQAIFIDNFFYRQDTEQQPDAFGVLLKPQAGIRSSTSRMVLSALADAELGTFNRDSDTSDYIDYGLSLGAEWTPARRHRLTYTGFFEQDHDPFGTERTDLEPDADSQIDEWRRLRNGLGYRFGAPTDRINLALGVNHLDKTYTTNETFTQFLDHQILSGEVTGYYNYSPKTAFFLSLIAADVEFDEVVPGLLDRSANERTVRAGVRWAASAKTSGDVGFGYVTREPDDSRRSDFDSLDWYVQLTWAPTAYRSFTLVSARSSQESFINNASFINNEFYNLRWTENWSQRLRSILSTGYLDSEFVGIARDDEAWVVEGGLEYRLTRALTLLGGGRWADRESTQIETGFERSHGYLGVRYTN